MKYYKYKMNAVYFNVFASILIVLGFLLHYCLFSNYIMEGSFLVYMVLWMFLHEILHGIGFMCFKEVSNKNVVFGAKLEKGVFYCMCKQLISKKIILTALLAPLVLIGIITLIIAIIFNLPTLALLSLFNISGAIGDIMMSIMFFNMPFVAMGVAMSTFVSQNKGANQGKRIREAIKICYKYDVIMAGIVTIILMIFAPMLVKMISGSSESIVLNNGAMYLRIVGPFYAILGILMQTRFALQGIGMKILPLISSIIEFVGKVIFVVVLIPRFEYMAVIFCEPVIWCFMTVQLVITFYTNSFIKESK